MDDGYEEMEEAKSKEPELLKFNGPDSSYSKARMHPWAQYHNEYIGTAVPVISFIHGIFHFTDCPAYPMIPIWLLISSTIGLFKEFGYHLALEERFYKVGKKPEPYCLIVHAFLQIAGIAWLIYGCFLVRNVWLVAQSEDSRAEGYCTFSAYIFNLVLIIIAAIYYAGFLALCLALLVSRAINLDKTSKEILTGIVINI